MAVMIRHKGVKPSHQKSLVHTGYWLYCVILCDRWLMLHDACNNIQFIYYLKFFLVSSYINCVTTKNKVVCWERRGTARLQTQIWCNLTSSITGTMERDGDRDSTLILHRYSVFTPLPLLVCLQQKWLAQGGGSRPVWNFSLGFLRLP